MNDSAERTVFLRSFRRHAQSVRRARLLRFALAGLGLGTCLASAIAGVRFFLLPDRPLAELTLPCVLAALVGTAAGLVYGWRRRFSDESVGLFLDARLGQNDEISAALTPQESTRLVQTVYERAAKLLAGAETMRPAILSRAHLSLPLGLALLLPSLLLTPPVHRLQKPATGAELARMDELPGLAALERLERIETLDPDTERRLDALAERAKKLEGQLENGLEKRAAQASIAELRDDIDTAIAELTSADQQAGLASAVDEFSRSAALRGARDALGRGDIVRFDAEMQSLATAAEQSSRDAAREALERARDAARAKGARALSSALAEQQRLFEQRERTSRLARQLASSLPSELGKPLSDSLGGALSDESMQQLADAMEKALQSLSDEELSTLGERLRKAIENGDLGSGPLDQEELQRLAKSFQNGHGQKELREMLQRLSRQSDAAQAMRGLLDADDGLRQAQRRAAGLLPVPRAARQGMGTNGAEGNSESGSEGGPGRGPGTGDHAGQTDPVSGDELRALARPRLDPKLPLQGAAVGRTSARPGETALTPQGAPLPGVSAEQLRGVEHSNIPEEYREQVSRYFAP